MELLCVRRDVPWTNTQGERVTLPCLVPAYRYQVDGMQRIPKDRIVEVRTRVSRDVRLHRQFWGIVTFTFDNLPEGYEFRHVDQLMDHVKIEVGFVNVCRVAGKVKEYPRSMAFDYCDENEFRKDLYMPGIALCADILRMSTDDLVMASASYAGVNHRHKRPT